MKTTENDIIGQCGQPMEIEDYGKNGKYFHYDNLRFSIFKGTLIGIDLFLMNSDKRYTYNFNSEAILIDRSTSLLKILNFLNNVGLKWVIPYEESKHDYLIINVSSGVKFFYFYEKQLIERISRSFL